MKELIGKIAPRFILKDKDGVEHSLGEIQSEYTVLYFYPKDTSPGCTIEAQEFSAIAKEFRKRDATVIGISGGDERSKKIFCDKYRLDLLLLSDPDYSVARKFGAYGKKELMGNRYEGILRRTLVLDRDKRVIKAWESVSPKGHPGEVLEYIVRHKVPAHRDQIENREDMVLRGHSHKRLEKGVTRVRASASRSAKARL